MSCAAAYFCNRLLCAVCSYGFVCDGSTSEKYTYDKNNSLLNLVNKKQDGSEISSYSYTYDPAGRQKTKTDSYGTTTYTYDIVGRVTKVEAPGKTTIYAYDKAGNRTSMNETCASAQETGFTNELSGRGVQYILKKSQYVYSNTNRLVKLVEEMYDSGDTKVLAKTTRYTFDANGNQLSEYASFIHQSDAKLRRTLKASASGDGQQTSPDPLVDRTKNTYDGFNRLVKVERLEAGIRTVAEYKYNGDDLRVKKTVRKSDNGYTPAVTSYLYDRQHVILETDGNGNTTARYIRGINYVAKYTGGKLSYLLYNGHGDVVQTVSAAGEVQNQYDYDIFGNPTLAIEVATCSIRYAGEYLDNETGLYYLRARYYDPNIGRFVSEDSYWGEDDNPLSLNLYTYAFNNPIRFIDPSGHITQEQYDAIIHNAQVNAVVNEINECKQTWMDEENGAGKNQKSWTAAQVEAHNRADLLRQQLAQLESGNEMVAELVNSHGNDAGLWEGYQLSITAKLAQVNPDKDYSDVIREQVKDYELAMEFGRNAIGIDSSKVKKEILTEVEQFAETLVANYQSERELAMLEADMGGEPVRELETPASGKRVYDGILLAYNGNISDLSIELTALSSNEEQATAMELLNKLMETIKKYPKSNIWNLFGLWKTDKQKKVIKEAYEIIKDIRETPEYKTDEGFSELFDSIFTKKSEKSINKKEDVQKMIDYLEAKPEATPTPTPSPTPTPFPTPEGTGNSDGTVYAVACTTSGTHRGGLTQAQMEANARYIYDYLTKEGWSKEAICGLLGNMQWESGSLNPGAWQFWNQTGKDCGYGLVQWTPAGNKFLKWAGLDAEGANKIAQNDPKQLMDKQLEFLLINLNLTGSKEEKKNYGGEWIPTIKYSSPYKMTVSEFINSHNDVDELAMVFHGSFERSGDAPGSTALTKRKEYANNWFKFFSK